MSPPHKTTPAEQNFIEHWMAEFMNRKANKTLDGFWPKMHEAYRAEFSIEEGLGLPAQNRNVDPNAEPLPPLTGEELKRLGDALSSKWSASASRN